MPRASRDAKLETRTARAKVKAHHEPYWVSIGKTLHLGYRKGTSGGSWIARAYIDGSYRKKKLGRADDFQDPDGQTVLDYFQAQEASRHFAEEPIQALTSGVPEGADDSTVAEAITRYLAWYKLNKKAYRSTEQAVNLHILPKFGKYKISQLTSALIRTWHQDLAKQARGSKARIKSVATAQYSPDELRKRKATANRVLTILKAALNHAWRDGHAKSDDPWRKVKPFKNVDHPKIRYLTVAECTRLVNSCDADFKPLIRCALLTGCRYGELIKLKVGDFDVQRKIIHVSETKNGKSRYTPLTDEGFYLLNW